MPRQKRPIVIPSCTVRVITGCGNVYITVGVLNSTIFEVFATLGKTGGCASSNLEAIGRSVSLGLQHGVPVSEFIEELKDIKCPNQTAGSLSCADAISRVLTEINPADPVFASQSQSLTNPQIAI